jgi:hypothetical protein
MIVGQSIRRVLCRINREFSNLTKSLNSKGLIEEQDQSDRNREFNREFAMDQGKLTPLIVASQD